MLRRISPFTFKTEQVAKYFGGKEIDKKCGLGGSHHLRSGSA